MSTAQRNPEKTPAGADVPRIPTYLFNVIASALREQGVEPTAMVSGSGVTLDQLRQRDARVSFNQARRLVANALAHSPDPALGLRVARQEGVASWGMLGYALAACASPLDAVRLTLRYFQASTYLTVPSLQEARGETVIRLDTLHPVGAILPFIMEESFGGALQIVRSVMDDSITPRELRLSYRAPAYREQYDTFFRCPVTFNQPANTLSFDSATLATASPAYNPASADMAEAMCRQITADQPREGKLVYQVRYLLLQSPGRFPQAAEVAARMNISERTLRRGLRSAGLSFQQVLDEVRAKIATDYLQTSDLDIEDIAMLTGFSDATNFSRAFKRWTGRSPSSLRLGDEHGQDTLPRRS